MILEMVTCDGCDWTDPMPGNVVPATWIVVDGKHFCCPPCLAQAREAGE